MIRFIISYCLNMADQKQEGILTRDSKIKNNVINFINGELDGDDMGLDKVKDVAVKLEETKLSLINKISCSDDASAPHKLGKILKSSNNALNKMKSLLSQRDELLIAVQTHTTQHKAQVQEFLPVTRKVEELERYLKYLHWIKCIEELNVKMQQALEINDSRVAVSHFIQVTKLYDSIMNTKCKNLLSFIQETIRVWHGLLKNKFASEFDEILKLMKWPFIPATTGIIHAPPYEILSKFEYVFGLLLDIHLPNEMLQKNASSHHQTKKVYFPLLPLLLLLLPFRKRFLYHFTGNKKTNSIDKPEWYFTQVLVWIRTHVPYIEKYIQPMLNRAGRTQVNAKVEFMRGLLELTITKLSLDIQEALGYETTLAHIINETLIFQRELRSHGYPSGLPSCFQVLTQDVCFTKWLNMEKKLAQVHVDKILSSSSAWSSQYRDHCDIDENKVPECGEKFLTMILSITDRYKLLPLPGHRLQFLELQLELIDDFHLRLCQLLENNEPLTSNFCPILNVVYYVTHVLQDWNDLPFFLQMQYYRLQHDQELQHQMLGSESSAESNHSSSQNTESVSEYLESPQNELDETVLNSMEGTLFEESLKLFEHMKDNMITSVTDYIIQEVKAKSRPYRHETWFKMPSLKEYVKPSVSPSACGMFLVLSSSLQHLMQVLALPLFNVIWQRIAEQLRAFIYEEVILMNKFNEGGAAQLQFDMTRNLFPIFAEYTRHPENHFEKIKEACILLTLSKGSGLLLMETLTADPDQLLTPACSSNPAQTLEEMGVYKLSQVDAIKILNLRTDFNIQL